VADVRHRLHHIEGEHRNWSAFFAAAADDPPLADGLDEVLALAEGHDVSWLSGRPQWLYQVTQQWLLGHGLPVRQLVLRPAHDRRPAAVFKVGAVGRLAAHREVAVVLDDDPAVVAAVRAAGWPARLAEWLPRAGTLDRAQEREGRT
jgi:hypothetical protein